MAKNEMNENQKRILNKIKQGLWVNWHLLRDAHRSRSIDKDKIIIKTMDAMFDLIIEIPKFEESKCTENVDSCPEKQEN